MRLKDYIQGDRRGKEANRFEREAMNDPFLQDALDGFDAVAGEHVKIIEQLEMKFSNPKIVPQRRIWYYWSAAASILLLLGFSAYFFLLRNNASFPQQQIAINQSAEMNDVASKDDLESALIEKLHLNKPEMQTNTRAILTEAPAPANELKIKTESLKISENDVSLIVADDAIIVSENAENAEIAEIEDDNKVADLFVADDNVSLEESVAKRKENKIAYGKIVDETDSSQLIVSFVSLETQQLKTFGDTQTVMLKQSDLDLDEIVVTGYGKQNKLSTTDIITKNAQVSRAPKSNFGEKEFQNFCAQNANKNVCGEQGANVKLSFFIDETGKPVNIEFEKYTCEDAKKEIEEQLASSPLWTKTNRKVVMTIDW